MSTYSSSSNLFLIVFNINGLLWLITLFLSVSDLLLELTTFPLFYLPSSLLSLFSSLPPSLSSLPPSPLSPLPSLPPPLPSSLPSLPPPSHSLDPEMVGRYYSPYRSWRVAVVLLLFLLWLFLSLPIMWKMRWKS